MRQADEQEMRQARRTLVMLSSSPVIYSSSPPLIVFSGFYINLESIGWWFRWISYISPVRYGCTAVFRNELEGHEFSCPPALEHCPVPSGEFVSRWLLFKQ